MQHSTPLRFFKPGLFFLLFFIGCTKQGPQGPAGAQGPQGQQGQQGAQGVAPTPTIVGYWTGAWSYDLSSFPTNPYNFLFRSDGTVKIYENFDTAASSLYEGTYAVHGDTVSGIYRGSFTFVAVVDSDYTFMQGFWGNTTDQKIGLFFTAK
ncbi:MAG TPA: hypothetical protein VFE32_00680 [Puia sp.]|jgi:hypothetical protein|nr:hypothetical protein [Puia sp.]